VTVAFAHLGSEVNPSVMRRTNLLVLLHEFAETAVSSGALTKGIEQAFAAKIQVSPSMLSQMKAGRPIGNKMARQIEALCAKPVGWMDEVHAAVKPTQAEEAFVELARHAWRAANAQGKRELMRMLKA